jgi:hypothetical protein
VATTTPRRRPYTPTTPDGGCYYMVDAAGEVFAFGDAVSFGGVQ